jgi:hypothetical protein
VASVEGAENSDWRSQTTVVNPTAGTRTATYYYVASGQSWPGTLLRGPVSLAPSQADFLEDPLVTLRPASGLVYVDLDDEGPVVTSRTYNLSPGGATFGQGIPALRLDGDQDPDSYILPMVHSGDGNFRTNLGIVQASGGTLTVRIDIYAATGVLMASENRSQDAAWRQINDVFPEFRPRRVSCERGLDSRDEDLRGERRLDVLRLGGRRPDGGSDLRRSHRRVIFS